MFTITGYYNEEWVQLDCAFVLMSDAVAYAIQLLDVYPEVSVFGPDADAGRVAYLRRP